ncbi:MAG: TlpA disulfide reductase family protein [Nannocystaceae bacterium]
MNREPAHLPDAAPSVSSPSISSPPISSPSISSPPASSLPAAEQGRPPPDVWAALGYMFFVAVGGTLVFSFASALGSAVQRQQGAACRELRPEPRDSEAADFEFVDRDGAKGRLSDYRGKFVVLNFWASWCEPCAREWPELDRLGHRFEARDDLVILAVSVDETAADMQGFLRKMSSTDTAVRVVHDPTSEANKLFGSEKLPDTFFVDRLGRVTDAFINVRRWGSQAAFHCVEHTAR